MTLVNSVLESNRKQEKPTSPLDPFFFLKKAFILHYLCVYLCVYMCMGVQMPQKPGEGSRSPGTGVIGVCELPDTGVGD